MSSRLSTIVAGWMDEAVAKHGDGENVLWDMTLINTEAGPGFFVTLFLSGAVVGTYLHNGVLLANVAAMRTEDAETLVRDVLEGLRQQRSQQLAEIYAPQGPNGSAPLGRPAEGA